MRRGRWLRFGGHWVSVEMQPSHDLLVTFQLFLRQNPPGALLLLPTSSTLSESEDTTPCRLLGMQEYASPRRRPRLLLRFNSSAVSPAC